MSIINTFSIFNADKWKPIYFSLELYGHVSAFHCDGEHHILIATAHMEHICRNQNKYFKNAKKSKIKSMSHCPRVVTHGVIFSFDPAR